MSQISLSDRWAPSGCIPRPEKGPIDCSRKMQTSACSLVAGSQHSRFECTQISRNEDKIMATQDSWPKICTDPSMWWDERHKKGDSKEFEVLHNTTEKAVWIDHRWSPVEKEAELDILKFGNAVNLQRAQAQFSEKPEPLSGTNTLCNEGRLNEAVQAVDDRYHQGIHVSSTLLFQLLQRCIRKKDQTAGRQVYELIVKCGFETDGVLGILLIRMFALLGSLLEANQVFSKISNPDVHSWSAIISAHVKLGQNEQAFKLYHQMQQAKVQPNGRIFISVLNACAITAALDTGMLFHSHLIELGLEAHGFVGNTLTDMYIKCGSLHDARIVFDQLPKRDVLIWNTMIAGYGHQKHGLQVLELFRRMQQEGITPNKVTFVSVLKTCSDRTALEEGKFIHAHIIEIGLQFNVYIGSSLVQMYSKCGSITDACTVFDSLPRRDVVTWSIMIAAYGQHGYGNDAVRLFLQMQHTNLDPNQVTFACILKVCTSRAILEQGMQIHHYVIQKGYESDVFLGVALVDMYVKCGSIMDAHTVFDKLPKQDVVTWNALIAGYGQHGNVQEAFKLFEQMHQKGIEPDKITYACMLKACASVAALEQGKWIHDHMVQHGSELDIFAGSSLIDMYGQCGSLQDACNLFDRLPQHDIVTWNAMITGYVQHGHIQNALQLLQQLQHHGINPDKVTFMSMLKISKQEMLFQNDLIENGLDWDLFVGEPVFCGDNQNLHDVRMVFDKLPERDVLTWNALIALYTQLGYDQEALTLFKKMQEEGMSPTQFTFVCILKACSSMGNLEQGKQAHMHIIESGLELGIFVGNTLIDMYGKCGNVMDALAVFEAMPNRDVVTWSALIAVYAQHGIGQEALCFFKQMQQDGIEPNQVTFVCTLKACAGILSLEQGKQVHSLIVEGQFETDLYVATTLVDMYSKCGSLEDAEMTFEELPNRGVVTWNNLIGGYAQYGQGQKALQLFQQMQQEDLKPDMVTYINILKSCSSIGALEQGQRIHACIVESGFDSDLVVSNSVIDMYCKCTSLHDAEIVFNRLPSRDVVSWSAMIAGCAEHCNYKLALQYFENMQRAGLKPNNVTFLCLLSACSRVGLIDEGCGHFKSMREDCGLVPALEHFNSMVELLGHAGRLNEAEDLLETIPLPLDEIGWTSLLASCRTYGDVNLGRRCFDHVVAIDRGNAAGYVLMSNIYAHASMWSDAERIEALRVKENVWKKPAKAFIEINNEVHDFVVADTTHPRSGEIYAKLEALSMQIVKEGYMPLPVLMSGLVTDEYKENNLCGHCERLAIALGLISTPQGATIRVSKNLRVCTDCHLASKMISKVEMREIIIKDPYCVHQFKEGICCCKA